MAKFTYLFEIPPFSYNENIIAISRNIFANSRKTCYVTLNKTAGHVKNFLADGGIFTTTYVFIDGISTAISNPANTNETTYLHYPLDIKELESVIVRLIVYEGVDSIIFDSISTLTTLPNKQEVINFLRRLIAQLAERRIISAFISVLTDTKNEIITHVAMSVDDVQEVRK